jgi:hypothetical protein
MVCLGVTGPPDHEGDDTVKKRFLTAGMMTALLAGGSLGFATVQQAAASGTIAPAPFEYSIKYVCGDFGKTINPAAPEVPEGPVKPGDYQTIVNIHNPNSVVAQFQKKAVLVFAGTNPIPETQFETPMPPGPIVTPAPLNPDYAMAIDCQDIRKVLLPGSPPAPVFVDGWVVLLSPIPLDVEAVYTAHGFNLGPNGSTDLSREGFSIDTERVLPTQKVR